MEGQYHGSVGSATDGVPRIYKAPMTCVRDEHAIPASGTIKVHAITRHHCGHINKVSLEFQFTRSSHNMNPEENVDKYTISKGCRTAKVVWFGTIRTPPKRYPLQR